MSSCRNHAALTSPWLTDFITARLHLRILFFHFPRATHCLWPPPICSWHLWLDALVLLIEIPRRKNSAYRKSSFVLMLQLQRWKDSVLISGRSVGIKREHTHSQVKDKVKVINIMSLTLIMEGNYWWGVDYKVGSRRMGRTLKKKKKQSILKHDGK